MRNEINLTDEQIEQAFEDLGYGATVSEKYGCDVVFTRETIENFVTAAKNYREYRMIVRGDNSLVITGVQVAKGERRRDVVVIDFGEVRGCFRD